MSYKYFTWLVFVLLQHSCVVAGSESDTYPKQQSPLIPGSSGNGKEVPGRSIIKLCPESSETDILTIERLINTPYPFYLDDEQDVLIWGTLTQNLTRASTIDYQINATANTGDFGALNGTFRICDYIEKMHQPPNKTEPEKQCPPSLGPIS